MVNDIEIYDGLVTSQHKEQPKFIATLDAFVEGWISVQIGLEMMPAYYDIDEANGIQLDAVGLWIGRSRQLEVPLEGVYFSFDIAGLGFGQGTWNGKYDPLVHLASLDDETYRALLKLKAQANSWDGTNEELLRIFGEFMAIYDLEVFMVDHLDMSMTIGVKSPITQAVPRELFLNGYIPLKPSGVRVNYLVPTVVGPIFAFDMVTPLADGFDVGAWATIS